MELCTVQCEMWNELAMVAGNYRQNSTNPNHRSPTRDLADVIETASLNGTATWSICFVTEPVIHDNGGRFKNVDAITHRIAEYHGECKLINVSTHFD